MSAQLQPRREVWELGFLPLHALWPQLDGVQSLLIMHAKLLERASPTPSGQWVIPPAELASVMELTNTQQDILCEVLGALSVLNGAMPDRPPPGSELVCAHEVSLFMFVQLFSKESQRAENLEVWPEAGPPSIVPFGMDGLLSPTRAMTVRTSLSGKATVRQQLQHHLRHQTQQLRGLGEYLRRNLKTLVELCLDPSPPSPGGPAGQPQVASPTQRMLKAVELERLRFVLNPSSQRQGCSLCSLLPGFTSPGAVVPLDVAVASLRQLWYEEVLQSPRVGSCSPAASMTLMSPMANKASRHLGLVAPAGQVDETSVSGVYKGTVVRGESDLPHGSLRITDCHDAVIYALAPVQCVYVSSCSETTVVVGAAGTLVRVERCEKLTLIAAAARVVVSSCHDCVLHLGTPRPPLLIGDCRFVRLAPFNTRYERQLAHVAAAGLRLDCPNRWDSPLVLVPKERRMGSSSGGTPDSPRAGSTPSSARGLLATTFSLLQPDELLPFVVPFQGTSGPLAGGPAPAHTTAWRQMVPSLARTSAASEAAPSSSPGGPPGGVAGGVLYLFPLPPEYERALHKKLAMTGELRARFRQAALNKDRELELNNTIQAYFKEWLSSSSMLRQIYDLSNLERERDDSSPPHDIPGAPTVSLPNSAQKDRVTLSL